MSAGLNIKAVVLAAGQSTRLRPVIGDKPKPMVRVDGIPILERNIVWLARSGVTSIFINLHFRPEAIRDHFEDGSRWGIHIQYSHEKKLLGTAGAVGKLRAELGADFLVIYGDNLTNIDLVPFVNFGRQKGGVGSLVVYERKDVAQSGILAFDSRRRVNRFLEKPNDGDIFSRYVSAGVFYFRDVVFDFIPESVFADFGATVIPGILKHNGNLYAYPMRKDEYHYGIDSPEMYHKFFGLLKKGTIRL